LISHIRENDIVYFGHDITNSGLVKRSDIRYLGALSGKEDEMGRKLINLEQTPARFPSGTLEQIDMTLKTDEKRADFLREAVERELKRRHRAIEREAAKDGNGIGAAEKPSQ